MNAIDATKEALKSETQRHKARIQEFSEEERKLRIAIGTGEELRDVEVREVRNERLHQVDMIRIDTGETIDSRPMTADERQAELPFEPDAKAKAKTAKNGKPAKSKARAKKNGAPKKPNGEAAEE